MSYKDKTWCTFWKDCKTAANFCDRAFYPSIEVKAREWSKTINQELFISSFIEKPECYIKDLPNGRN